MPVGGVFEFDLSQFNEFAPHWRIYDVRRGSLEAWEPEWGSERMDQELAWTGEDSEVMAVLEGEVGAGRVDGMIFWVEAAGVADDPGDLLVSGVITPAEAFEVGSSSAVQLTAEFRVDEASSTEANCVLSYQAA